jgi:hypothetical protein
MSNIVPFSAKTRLPREKAIPVPTPFRFKPGRVSPHFPKNENRKREATGLQSCNPCRDDDQFILLILLRFTQFPHGPLLALFTVGKTQRTLENGGREMKIRSAGRVQRIGFAAFAFALAFLACGAATASDVEWQIPVIRDAVGSGLTTEISREGTRQTATPFLTLYNPTIQEIEDRIVRIVKITARLAAKEIPPGEITVRSVQGFLKGLRASRNETPAPAVVVAVREQRLGMADTSPR